MSILVLGDAMIDKHTQGDVTRISPEAPVPVVNAGPDSRYSLGAAANVAAQIAKADIECFFAYRAFDNDPDGSHDRFGRMCVDAGIRPRPLIYPNISFPVTTKERIWAESQQLCRVDREFIQKPNRVISDKWINYLINLIEQTTINVIIFSDYDKGTLTDYIIQQIADYCYNREIITILDPKRYSYWGLQHLTMIKPNSKEIAITNMNVEEVSTNLGNTLLLNTLGKNGMKLWKNGQNIFSEKTYVESKNIVDVCGCGDTVSAFLGIGYSKQWPVEKSIKLASLAAAINTKYRGCHVLTKQQIESISN